MNNSIATKHIKHAKNLLGISKYKQLLLDRELPNFKFDLTDAQIEYGITPRLLTRINNMAYEFIFKEDMSYKKAIGAAYLIVTQCPIAECEEEYVDVEEFLKGSGKYGFG